MTLSQTHRHRTLTKGESCDRGHPRPPGTPLPARPPDPAGCFPKAPGKLRAQNFSVCAARSAWCDIARSSRAVPW